MSQLPKFSIIIPAHNEEQCIGSCLASIEWAAAHLGPGGVEVIVVLNRCTDRTEEIARGFGAIIVYDDSKNLAKIRNAGCKEAKAPLLITVDADSRLAPGTLKKIERAMSSGRYLGGGVTINMERWSLGILITYSIYLLIALRYRILCGLFFVERDAFYAIGGFNEELCSVEDVDFAVRLRRYARRQGKCFKMLFGTYITTSSRKFDHFGDWYFVRHPWSTLKILRGRDRELADRVWYEFKK